jgi:parvulin-like peptidyl-prolyl isomerase
MISYSPDLALPAIPEADLIPPICTASDQLQRLQHNQLAASEWKSLLASYRLLPQLYQELVIDQAIAPFTLSPEESAAALQQWFASNSVTTEAQQQPWLAQQQLTLAQAHTLAGRSRRLEHYKQATWGHKLEAHFLTCKAQMDQVVYSVLRVRDVATAQELFFRIQSGEEAFAKLAAAYSQGPEAQTGGLVGPMPLSQPHPALAQRLRSAQSGSLIAPFQLGEWVLLARLEQLIPARLDAATQQKLLDSLFQTWLQAAVQTAMQADSECPSPAL